MMFLFYGIAFYFFNTDILVIMIVNICFKKNGHSRRDEYQIKFAIMFKKEDKVHISF